MPRKIIATQVFGRQGEPGGKGDTGDVTPAALAAKDAAEGAASSAVQVLADTEGVRDDAVQARAGAELAASAAEAHKAAVEAVQATNDGIMTSVAEDPGSGFRGVLTGAIEAAITGTPYLDSDAHTLIDLANRPDTAAGLGVATSGQAWGGGANGAAVTRFRILDGRIVTYVDGGGRHYAKVDTLSPDHHLRAELRTSATANRVDVGIVLRATPTEFNGVDAKQLYARMRKATGGVDDVILVYAPTGSPDRILATHSAAGITPSTDYVLEGRVDGRRCRVWLDGALIIDRLLPADVHAAVAENTHAGLTVNTTYDLASSFSRIDAWRIGPKEPTEARFVAHRGTLTRLDPQLYENRIEGLDMLPGWVDAVEIDVRFSSQGTPHLMHDATVDRTTLGSGNIIDKTDAELAGLNVPTLAAYLAAVAARDHIGLVLVDCASGDGFAATWTVVDSSDVTDKCILMVRSAAAMEAARTAAPTARLGGFGVTAANAATYLPGVADHDPEVMFVSPGEQQYLNNRSALTAITSAGYSTGASSVNAGRVVRQALADEVDYVLTDTADLVDRFARL